MSATVKAESAQPGLLLEVVNGILRRQPDQMSINMTESLLKMQSTVPEFEGLFHD